MSLSGLGFYIFIFVASLIFILAILSNGKPIHAGGGETLIKTVVIEGLADKPMPQIETAFCESSAKSSLIDIDKKCQTLSDKNCSLVSCCIFLNGEKCVGGSSSGPTYLSVNGENVDVNYYRHKTTVYK
jgi:hypothetical protein